MTSLHHYSRLRMQAFALLVAFTSATALASNTGSIYTCVDAYGRKLTSDRLILECIDREQRELSPNGVLRRIIAPAQTAAEREARLQRARQAELAREKLLNAQKRDRALLRRYPDNRALESDRQQALAQSEAVIQAAQKQIAELNKERQLLNEEMEFYIKDPSKAPAKLHANLQDNANQIQGQEKIIEAQKAERLRINTFYDQQAWHLESLWQSQKTPSKPASTPHS